MSKWDKLISCIMLMPGDVRFSELKTILESYGYTMSRPRGGSSHCVFRKDGCFPITIPLHEPTKRVYVKMVRDLIEENRKNENG
ncbi:MAG: type II toxin-antitoxin system HicA family toxin [Erysipelotrichaceae bacterium]|nr:type II toxin-antitoxin system HicA family toxin [Erysipelotrichaceae bacterium]